MSSDTSLLELKLHLKKWENNFIRKHGVKPNKNDIEENQEAKELYIKYARLKKNIKSMTDEGKEQSQKKQTVWGSNLLKINCHNNSVGNGNGEMIETNLKSIESLTPVQSYRDKIRKNIGHNLVHSLPTSLKNMRTHMKDKKQIKVNEMSSIGCVKSTEMEEEYSTELANTSLLNRSTVVKKPGKITSRGYSLNNSTTPSRKRQIINTSVNISWINESAEDLSDLINLKKDLEPTKSQSGQFSEDLISIQNESKAVFTQSDNVTNEKLKEKDNFDSTEIIINKENIVLTTPTCSEKENSAQAIQSIPAANEGTHEISLETRVESCKKSKSAKIEAATSKVSSSGLVSSNFVRVNMKQKTYCKRGKGRILRKQVFREKLAKKGFSFRSGWKGRSGGASKVGFRDKSEDKCFKCGEHGHWASKCKQTVKFQPKTAPDLEERPSTAESITDIMKDYHRLHADAVSIPVADHNNTLLTLEHAQPLYDEATFDEREVRSVLKQFGFDEFRPGQAKAIKRILCGKPTLLVLSTGSGKSLCYQLPSYMYSTKRKSITLVISPLVSLMDDQVHGLPKFLKATRLHSGMTKEQREKTMLEIENGKVDILLVSPEALTLWAGMTSHTSPLSRLPAISFVCVDECHCLSEWSHSFRPSYLRVCQVLQEQLGVQCMVGLTATATKSACLSVAKQLGISDPIDGLIMDMSLPKNLTLTISRDIYKDEALEQLLNGKRFKSLDSVIIYCTRREEAARLAAFLRTKAKFQQFESNPSQAEEDFIEESSTKKRKRGSKKGGCKRKAIAWEAECYHAGMSSAERRKVQNRFMSGQLRIVVATVAFGMGIDKQDVRAVIHYNMPRSFERYVQEVGRAGRDRSSAHCHLLLNGEGGDLFELARHTYGKSVDRYTVKQLVQAIFQPCQCSKKGSECFGHFVSIPIDSSVQDLDLAKEGIETLLCYLEMDSLVKVFLPTHTTCYVHCYEGAEQMIKTAKKCPAVALALSLQDKDEKIKNEVEFSLVKVANLLGMDVFTLKRTLRGLMWDTSLASGASGIGKSGVTVQYRESSFLLRTKKTFSNELVDAVTTALYQRTVAQERKEIEQLHSCFNTMHGFSRPNAGCCMDDADEMKSDALKSVIDSYFQDDEQKPVDKKPVELDLSSETALRSSIHQFLCIHSDDLGTRLTGRAIARIFHGIDSPKYPAKTWGPAKRFWRSHLHIDFNAIVSIATDEVVKFR